MLVKDSWSLFTLPVPQFDLLNHRIHLSQSIAHDIRTVIFLAQILIEVRMDFFLAPWRLVFTERETMCSYISSPLWQYSEVEWVVHIEMFLYNHSLLFLYFFVSFFKPSMLFKTPKVSIYTTNEHLLYSNTEYSSLP